MGNFLGVSTRLMGALIMTHSDDHGLVLPPRLAPFQVVIVPIFKEKDQLSAISKEALRIKALLERRGIAVKYDDRKTHKPGWKFAEYELKGVPIRLALGGRDIENNTIELARRDTMSKEVINIEGIDDKISHILEEIQRNLFEKASDFRRKILSLQIQKKNLKI